MAIKTMLNLYAPVVIAHRKTIGLFPLEHEDREVDILNPLRPLLRASAGRRATGGGCSTITSFQEGLCRSASMGSLPDIYPMERTHSVQ